MNRNPRSLESVFPNGEMDEGSQTLFGRSVGAATAAGAARAPSLATPAGQGSRPTLDEARQLAARVFGIERLRPLQERAVEASLAGRDLLLVLPTGGGKSLCYQAPALLRPGFTCVVSPLVSLMKDQVDGLAQNGVAAAMLASVQEPDERRAVLRELRAGRLRLLFVAPERLMLPGFLEHLLELGLSAVAVDEAHCISHWGHDFRPEYRRLGELKEKAPHLLVHAFTATATDRVREDVVRQLSLTDPAVLVGGCDRPNLTYRVRPRHDLVRQVLEVVGRHEGQAGIVYAISRRDVERLDEDLRAAGVRSAAYHAGLEPELRRRTQERFLNEEVDVVCATVAFGMGIDRTDVRFVVHAALPKGIEQYGQETGRAGRDGLPAECVLFYSGADFHSWRSLLERSQPETQRAQTGGAADLVQDGDTLAATLERLSVMAGYTTRLVCRHRQLVEYFGQSWERPEELAQDVPGCGACDVCLGEIAAEPDSLVIAQKILSCVVHCEQRYGAHHVASVLRGASTAGIRRAGHDRVSTHGLLRERSMREVRGWIDQLIGLDHLRISGERYPILHVSPSGAEILRGKGEVTLLAIPRSPKEHERRSRPSAAPTAEADGAPVDAALFEELRELRRELARERQVPPYLIFNDRTLAALAALAPKTHAELLGVKGIGEKKAADLGPAFLERIARHVGATRERF